MAYFQPAGSVLGKSWPALKTQKVTNHSYWYAVQIRRDLLKATEVSGGNIESALS